MGALSEVELLQAARAIVPRLDNAMHKGQCGKIAVFGGCVMYTGAPYFAAISALKCGADLVHVFCEQGAGAVIKSYSPELVVSPVLDMEYGIEEIELWLPRQHCVVLGPGLGRNQSTLGRMSLVVEKAKALGLPIILDADALWQVNANPRLVQGYTRAVLTPNAMEFSRLVKAVLHREAAPSSTPDPGLVAELAAALGHVTVLHKGLRDIISDGRETLECGTAGSPRRCGGQGDLLAGALATFLHWALGLSHPPASPLLAAWAASRLARGCGELAFARAGRSVTTSDMVAAIQPVFSRLYEGETSL
jgi:ATP-dependent NAD(P)H-hydrate dehydratase